MVRDTLFLAKLDKTRAKHAVAQELQFAPAPA